MANNIHVCPKWATVTAQHFQQAGDIRLCKTVAHSHQPRNTTVGGYQGSERRFSADRWSPQQKPRLTDRNCTPHRGHL